jgi:hypothetical protein
MAVIWPALTNVVGRACPFHIMLEPEVKPVPSTVSVVVELPARINEGEIWVTLLDSQLLINRRALAERSGNA